MEAETASAIIAGVSALVAIGAAVVASVFARRSAAAEERSAKAAEDALAIERKRFEHEQEDRAEATAPRIDAGEKNGTRWVVAQGRRALVGFLTNHGPGGAFIETAELEGPSAPAQGQPVRGEWPAYLAEHQTMQARIEWPFEDAPSQVSLTATYRASGESGYRAAVDFTLLRDGADPNGQPLYRQGEAKRRRLA